MLCMCVKYLSSVGVCLKAPLSVFYYNMDERERRCRCLARQTSERDNTGRPRAGRGQPAGFSQGFARWFAQADRTHRSDSPGDHSRRTLDLYEGKPQLSRHTAHSVCVFPV